MPFTSYTTVLDPETMRAAQKAYDLAWAEIKKESDGYDVELTRNLLAKRIIEAIKIQDKRDPENLKAYALAGFKP